MPTFPEAWFPGDDERTRLAKEVTRLHWDLIRDDATIGEIKAAGYAAADLLRTIPARD